jgi:hypothetical protein
MEETMRKIFIMAMTIFIGGFAFADFQIGPTALYNLPVMSGPSMMNQGHFLSFDDFAFGLDTRLNIWIFQGSAYALFTRGKSANQTDPAVPHDVRLNMDLGLCFDLLVFRLGAGIGPSFLFSIPYDSGSPAIPNPVDYGFNIKLAADLMLGNVALSAVYLTDTALTANGAAQAIQKWNGRVGLSILFKLF